MFGYTEEELLHGNLNLVHPEDIDCDKQLSLEMYSGKHDGYHIEKRYLAEDGNEFLGRLSYSIAHDADGEPRLAIGIVEDISEERKAQDELRQSEARFRAIFENTAVGIALMNLEKGTMQVNLAAQRIVGYSQDDLININPSDLAITEDRYIDKDQFARLVAGQIDQYQVEKRYTRKNGDVFWARVTYSSVREASGKPQYLIGLIEDIDEEKRSEEKNCCPGS